jgi:zinc finger CCHC domain-containing protein 9
MATGKKEELSKGVSGQTRPRMSKEERRNKYTDIARKRRQKKNDQQRSQHVICYHCREHGHFVTDCPSKEKSELETSICYKCGSTEHALSACPKRKEGKLMDLPFASCFVCKEKGHLASKCPKNTKGVYVNGGECRYCGSRDHLASKCQNKKKTTEKPQDEGDDNDVDDLLESDVPIGETSKEEAAPVRKRRVVKF